MARLPIDARRRAESDLRNYPRYKRELDERWHDLAHQSTAPADGLPKARGRTGDPTYQAVLRLSTNARIEFLARTCETVERCLAVFDRDHERLRNKQRIIELFYWREGYSIERIARELNYSVRSVYVWRAEILETIAEEMGYLA